MKTMVTKIAAFPVFFLITVIYTTIIVTVVNAGKDRALNFRLILVAILDVVHALSLIRKKTYLYSFYSRKV